MSLDETPWTGRLGVSLLGVSPMDRQRRIIDVLFAKACASEGVDRNELDTQVLSKVTDTLICDPSQTLTWGAVTGKRMTTQTTKSTKYSYSLDRTLITADVCGMFGYPKDMLDCLSEHSGRSLIGEAVAAPSFAVVMYALMCCSRFPGVYAS